MLMVHGVMTYSFIWGTMSPALSERYDVIAVDLLGCGESAKPEGEDYSPKAQAAMLLGLMDGLGLEKVHLVTHDIGGAVGQILAAKHHERLLSLTLINTVAYDYWPVQPIISFQVPIIRQLAMAILDIRILRRMVARGMYHRERLNDEIMKQFFAPMRAHEGRQGFLQLAKGLDNTQLMDIMDEIHATPVPVMIVRGDADVYLRPDIAERLHKSIKGARLERISTGGHFIQLDEPQWLVGKIISFCSAKKAVSAQSL